MCDTQQPPILWKNVWNKQPITLIGCFMPAGAKLQNLFIFFSYFPVLNEDQNPLFNRGTFLIKRS